LPTYLDIHQYAWRSSNHHVVP